MGRVARFEITKARREPGLLFFDATGSMHYERTPRFRRLKLRVRWLCARLRMVNVGF
jgi:hypothetical protein